jgi:hypothetical protein
MMFWLVGPRTSVLWVFLGGRFYVGRSWSQRSSWLLLLVLDILEAAFCLPHLTIWFLDGRALKTPNYWWYSEVDLTLEQSFR